MDIKSLAYKQSPWSKTNSQKALLPLNSPVPTIQLLEELNMLKQLIFFDHRDNENNKDKHKLTVIYVDGRPAS